jgi:peptidoglycan/xylan/chitin deacetylase (PgdA/CDA1 family)
MRHHVRRPGVKPPLAALLLAASLLTALHALAASPAPAAGLFSPEELAQRQGENLPGKLHAPDLSPPARLPPAVANTPLPEALRGSIRRVDTGGVKLVAMTFDLCELSDQRAGYDGALVEALRAQNVPATFFASGKWLRSHPERAMQLLADPLFELGNHAWTHGNMGVLPPDRMREQIEWTQAQYELTREALAKLARERGQPEAVSHAPSSITLFRFPYGRCRPEALSMLAGMGIAAVQWDVNTMDAAKGRTADGVARGVERAVKPGSIVLGHANGFGRATAEALKILVPALRAKGYRFVTVNELLRSGKAVTAAQCYDSRPGDTTRYDALYGDGTAHRRSR